MDLFELLDWDTTKICVLLVLPAFYNSYIWNKSRAFIKRFKTNDYLFLREKTTDRATVGAHGGTFQFVFPKLSLKSEEIS